MEYDHILVAVTLLLWAAGFLLLPLLGRGLTGELAAPPPEVSVIIPARNEEHNLPALLGSIRAQSVKPAEIIVVDDGSTDRTAEVARGLGARVLASRPLPDGWRGKTWACHQGAQIAISKLLLFVDADTWFEPGGLGRILANYAGGAYSIGPYHAVQRPYEQLSLFFNFNMTVGVAPRGLFGQMLLVDHQAYRGVGGHEVVRGRILENFWLARQFRSAGVPTNSAIGRGVFSFRMYPNGLRELIEGWTKGFASGAGQTPRGTLALTVLWMIGLMLAPLGCVISGGAIPAILVYLLGSAQVAWFCRLIGAFRWYAALLYPVPLVFFFVVFAWSAARSGRQVRWKGREIRAD